MYFSLIFFGDNFFLTGSLLFESATVQCLFLQDFILGQLYKLFAAPCPLLKYALKFKWFGSKSYLKCIICRKQEICLVVLSSNFKHVISKVQFFLLIFVLFLPISSSTISKNKPLQNPSCSSKLSYVLLKSPLQADLLSSFLGPPSNPL